VVLAAVIVSVCLSVSRVLYDKAKQYTADILIPHERAITPVFMAERAFELGDFKGWVI